MRRTAQASKGVPQTRVTRAWPHRCLAGLARRTLCVPLGHRKSRTRRVGWLVDRLWRRTHRLRLVAAHQAPSDRTARIRETMVGGGSRDGTGPAPSVGAHRDPIRLAFPCSTASGAGQTVTQDCKHPEPLAVEKLSRRGIGRGVVVEKLTKVYVDLPNLWLYA